MPFLPKTNALRRVNAALTGTTEPSWTKQMEAAAVALEHDSGKVRMMALEQLRNVLVRFRSQITASALSDVPSPFLAKVIASLMQLSADSDPGVRMQVAVCLGELGAIDPARISVAQKPTVLE